MFTTTGVTWRQTSSWIPVTRNGKVRRSKKKIRKFGQQSTADFEGSMELKETAYRWNKWTHVNLPRRFKKIERMVDRSGWFWWMISNHGFPGSDWIRDSYLQEQYALPGPSPSQCPWEEQEYWGPPFLTGARAPSLRFGPALEEPSLHSYLVSKQLIVPFNLHVPRFFFGFSHGLLLGHSEDRMDRGLFSYTTIWLPARPRSSLESTGS